MMSLKQFATIFILTVVLGISVCFNLWQLKNVREVEKFVGVPVEVPRDSFLENFDIRNVQYLAIQFKDNSFHFIDGSFSFCLLDWYGHWDTTVTLTNTSITNCTIYLDNFQVNLEYCKVENTHVIGTFNSAVHLNHTTFIGASNVFDVPVCDRGGNSGMENVTFNEGVFPWE